MEEVPSLCLSVKAMASSAGNISPRDRAPVGAPDQGSSASAVVIFGAMSLCAWDRPGPRRLISIIPDLSTHQMPVAALNHDNQNVSKRCQMSWGEWAQNYLWWEPLGNSRLLLLAPLTQGPSPSSELLVYFHCLHPVLGSSSGLQNT